MILSYMVKLQFTLGESARLFSTVVTHLPTMHECASSSTSCPAPGMVSLLPIGPLVLLTLTQARHTA